MNTKRNKIKKSLFITKSIRTLYPQESTYLEDVSNVVHTKTNSATVANIPQQISTDNVSRPLILTKEVVIKITQKHGNINPINLIITAHDWDIIIKNIDNTAGKICIIKYIPNSDNLLLLGAFKRNGYFILSHYEVHITQSNQLKSLLGRGDVIRKDA